MSTWIERSFGIDPRGLAATRIALGAVLLYDLAARARDLNEHYTDAGIAPRALVASLYPGMLPSLHALSGGPLWAGACLLLGALAATALLLGWRTRLATVAAFLLTLSLHIRDPLITNGGDVLLRLLLMWSFFLPMGARWSLDARRGEAAPTAPVVSAAGVAWLLQVLLMYWDTAAWKSDPAWFAGTALHQALSLELIATDWGIALRDQLPWLAALGSQATRPLEALGPALALLPWPVPWVRVGVVLTFWAFHLGTALTMRLSLFPVLAMVAWIPFLPRAIWDRLDRGGGGAVPSTLRWDLAAALAFGATTLSIAHNHHPDRSRWLDPLERGLALAMVHQNWVMFAPRPPEYDSWLILAGTDAAGHIVDQLTGVAPTRERPPHLSRFYGTDRRRQYFARIGSQPDPAVQAQLAAALGRWACAQGELEQVEITIAREHTAPPGGEEERRFSTLPVVACLSGGSGSN